MIVQLLWEYIQQPGKGDVERVLQNTYSIPQQPFTITFALLPSSTLLQRGGALPAGEDDIEPK